MSSHAQRVALRTSLVYAVLGGLWILGSDSALDIVARTPTEAGWLQTYKGWAFVAITALLLYAGLRAQLEREERIRRAREAAEAELKRERERLQQAAKAANIGFWDWDIASGQRYFSSLCRQQLGYGESELSDNVENWRSLLHPEDRDRVMQSIEELATRPNGKVELEFRLRHRDGHYRWILLQGAVEVDASGKPVRVLGSHVDITNTKASAMAQQERSEMNARLAHIAAVVPGAIASFQLNPDGSASFPYTSPAVKDVYGVDPETIARDATPIFNATHPDDLPHVRQTIDESARLFTPWRCEFRYRHPTKGEVWIEGFSLPERQANGTLRWNGFVMDITARKRAELRIHQLNRVYSLLSDVNETIVRVRGEQRLFEEACRIAVEKGGFRMVWIGKLDEARKILTPVASAGNAAEYLGDVQHDFRIDSGVLKPSTRAAATGERVVINNIEHDAAVGPGRDLALKHGYRSCAAFPLRVRGVVTGTMSLYSADTNVFDGQELNLLDEMALDISFALEASDHERERLGVEAALRENEERFRQLAENVREVFWLADPIAERVLYVSPVFETVWGRSPEPLYGNAKWWYDFVHPEDRPRIIAAANDTSTLSNFNEEYRIVRPDGSIRWLHSKAFPVLDAGGRVYRVAGVTEDITERKQLEGQFFRAQRLEAIGTLASGIAHDLNNILAPIMMCAPMLRMGLPTAEFEKMLATIEASTRRGADLVRQLLVFGRGIEGGRVPVRPKDLVSEMAKIARETFPKHIVVRCEVGEDLWPVVGDATQLHQVLLNLCVNARDAMPSGGELALGARNVTLDEAETKAHRPAKPGPYVRFRVTDTGVGIAPEVADKIFDPFFTTKEPGKGTGLGLSTVLGIVKSHGGFVRLQSEPGQGSEFEVYIPGRPEAAPAPTVQNGDALPRGKSELVLLVEDEASIREVAADLLVRHGYRVMTAEDGVEAETLFRENIDDIAVVLTDLDMPRMNGVRLIESVRRLKPKVAVIVSSGMRDGRSPADRPYDLQALAIRTVLTKPYDADELVAAVNRALSSSSENGDTPS